MTDFFDKYIKYNEKNYRLKKIVNEDDNSNMIALLWLNKFVGPIEHIVDGKNLDIKQNIIKTHNKLKITYQNPNVVLFLNFDKIIQEDFEWLKENNIDCVDVNQFEVIKNNECLDKMYNYSKYGLEHLIQLPIYVQVDMTKILIQYEYMIYHNYNYVTFVDLDIKTNGDDLENVICKPIRPDFTGELYPNKLLDNQTKNVLDIFGYMVAGFSNPSDIADKTRNAREIKREQIHYSYEMEDYGKPINFIKIDKKIYALNSITFENSFLISKNSPNTIRAIKEYFIDHVFCGIIYNDYINNMSGKYSGSRSGFIYTDHYLPFFIYLHMLNQLIYIDFELDMSIEDNIIFFNELTNKFVINKDYITSDAKMWSKPYKIIKIMNINMYKFFTNKFGFPQANMKDLRNDRGYVIRFTESYIPENKINLFFNNMINLSGEFNDIGANTIAIPYKCVGLESSKNVNSTKY